MSNQLVITIITDDRPGVVEQVAAIVSRHQGNWLQSALSRLGGKFAGIVLIDIDLDNQAGLETDLSELSNKGIRVTIDAAGQHHASVGEKAEFEVIGNDRKGIVEEISQVLARADVSVDELTTRTESAPMSGEMLFIASACVVLPEGMDRDDLQSLLEKLSADLMVEFEPRG